MTYDSDDFALFAPDENADNDLLGELDSLKGLLEDSDAPPPAAHLQPDPAASVLRDIPVLSEVVAHPDDGAADALSLRAAMEPDETVSATPGAADIEAIVEVLLERQLPQIRARLRDELLGELRQRGLLR